jgi:hypothetical protein
MTIGELKERIEELELSDSTEIVFYDPMAHETLLIDTGEAGIYDPSMEAFTIHFAPEDHTGVPCLALYI